MSADAWRECPRCKDQLEEILKNSYGKVSAEEYLRIVSETEDRIEETPFREDYEILMDDEGEFYINYHGECTQCGLKHKFKHTEQVYTRKNT